MKKVILITVSIIILLTIIFLGIFFVIKEDCLYSKVQEEKILSNLTNNIYIKNETDIVILNDTQEKEITDWRLVLVNYKNSLPDNFEVTLSNIDSSRQFDSRAIEDLLAMQKQMKKDKVGGAWVQSAYRSIEYQEKLYNEKVHEIMKKQGLSREEAEKQTSKFINKSETSEHNLGLAVDFNYVNSEFENTKAFKWLIEHAEEYGFILRYKKEKEEITKVKYEPWHWRYVGKEHATAINDLDMCLEEYIDYLKKRK